MPSNILLKALVVIALLCASLAATRVSWKKLSTSGTPVPQEGSSCHLLFSDGAHKLHMLGGRTSPTSWNRDSVSVFHPGTKKWTREVFRGAEGKLARSHHSTVVYNNKVYIFGGRITEFLVTNDLFVLDPEAKTVTQITDSKGTPPSPRERHAAIVMGSKMIVVGGHDNDKQTFHDTAAYDIETNTWEAKRPTGSPGARSGHKLLAKGSRYVYALGGREFPETFPTDIAELDLEAMTWSTFPTETFDPRSDFSASVVGDIAWIFGGHNRDIKLDDVKAWDIHNNKWLDVLPSGGIERRAGHCSAADLSGVYIIGGQTGYWKMLNDMYFLETGSGTGPATGSGAAPTKATLGFPFPRHRSTVFVTLEDRQSVLESLRKQLAESDDVKDVEDLNNAVYVCGEVGPKAQAVEAARGGLERSRGELREALTTALALSGLLDSDNQTDHELSTKLEDQKVALAKMKRDFLDDETRHSDHTRRVAQLQDALGRFRDQQEVSRARRDSKIKEISAVKSRVAAAEENLGKSDKALQALKKENRTRAEALEKQQLILQKKQKEVQNSRDALDNLQGQIDTLAANRTEIELRIQKVQMVLDDADKVRGAVEGAELAAQSASTLSQNWMAEAEEEVDLSSTAVGGIACERHTNHKTVVKKLEDKLAQLRKELDASSPAYKALSSKIQKERERLADLTAKEQELVYAVDTDRLQLQRVHTELSAQERKHAADQQQLNNVKDELSRAEAGLKELNGIHENKKQLADDHEKKLKEDELAYQTYNERYARTQTVIAKHETEIASLQGLLERQLSQRDERMQAFAALKKNLSTLLGAHQAAHQLFRADYEKVTQALSRLALCKNERVEVDLSSKDAMLAAAKAKTSQLVKEVDQFAAENADQGAQLKNCRAEAATLRADLEAARKEAKRAQDELMSCKAALEICQRK